MDRGQPSEPVMVLIGLDLGSIHPYELRDTGSRCYRFVWDRQYNGHVLKCPLSVWMADNHRLAREIMGQRRLPFPILTTVEIPEPPPEPEPEPESESESEPEPESESESESGSDENNDAEEEHSEQEPPPEPDSFQRIRIVLADGRKMRAKELSAETGIPESELRALLESTDSPAEIQHAGWIALK